MLLYANDADLALQTALTGIGRDARVGCFFCTTIEAQHGPIEDLLTASRGSILSLSDAAAGQIRTVRVLWTVSDSVTLRATFPLCGEELCRGGCENAVSSGSSPA